MRISVTTTDNGIEAVQAQIPESASVTVLGDAGSQFVAIRGNNGSVVILSPANESVASNLALAFASGHFGDDSDDA